MMFVVLGVAALWVALPAPARAQTAQATAEQAAEQAGRAQSAGKLNDAIEGYARAYQLGGDPVMLFRMAEVHRQAGHDADALRTFQTYLRRDPQGAHRESAEAQARQLDQKLRQGSGGNVTAAPPVSVVRAPATAPAPTPVRSPVVAAPAATQAPAPAAVSSAPTAAPPARVSPPPMVTPPPVSPPTPVASAPRASLSPLPFASPTGTGEAQPPGVDLRSTAPPPAAASSSPPLPRWVPWTLAATTVALGTGAIISGLSASHRFDDLKSSCGQTAQGCEAGTVDDMKSRALRANLLWAATGIAAVATGVTVYVNASAAGVSGLWAF